MDHLTALAAAVADNPGDRHTRLVLADALDEAGRVEEAEILRQPGYFQYYRRCLLWRTNDQHYVNILPFWEPPDCQGKDCPGSMSAGRFFYPTHGWLCVSCLVSSGIYHYSPYP